VRDDGDPFYGRWLLSPYTPSEPCGCYYESTVGTVPTSCVACTAGAGTCAAGTSCHHGFCEADDGRTSLSDCSALPSNASHTAAHQQHLHDGRAIRERSYPVRARLYAVTVSGVFLAGRGKLPWPRRSPRLRHRPRANFRLGRLKGRRGGLLSVAISSGQRRCGSVRAGSAFSL